jgi:type II secretory pathway pseudopilin PulG
MKRLAIASSVAVLLLAGCSKASVTVTSDASASQDKAAQSALRNALAASKTYFTDGDTYTGLSPTTAASIEPGLTWTGRAPATMGAVSIDLADGSQLVLSTVSASGQPFCVGDNAAVGTTFGTMDAAAANTATDCGGATWGT